MKTTTILAIFSLGLVCSAFAVSNGDLMDALERATSDDSSNEVHNLAKQLADWCKTTGKCSLDDSLLKMNTNDDENVPAKRGVGAVNDLCRLYRVKCKRSAPPVVNDESSELDVRSASSIGDLCKLYNVRCRREDGSVASEEEEKIYWSTVRQFLNLCQKQDHCDFGEFVANVAKRVQSMLVKEMNVELGDWTSNNEIRELMGARELMRSDDVDVE